MKNYLTFYSDFTYDGPGNRTGETVNILGQSALSGAASYAYSSKGQLTQEQTRPTWNTMTSAYDDAGNPSTLNNATHAWFPRKNYETYVCSKIFRTHLTVAERKRSWDTIWYTLFYENLPCF